MDTDSNVVSWERGGEWRWKRVWGINADEKYKIRGKKEGKKKRKKDGNR